MTKEIPLTRGHVTLVDTQDFDRLSQHKWLCTSHGYAGTDIAHRRIYMHRMIMNPPDGLTVDHINGNGLDNRRSNLRLATHRQNVINRLRLLPNTASKYRGVFAGRHTGWRAQIFSKGKSIPLGTFRTQREAALAYNEAAKIHHGDFAMLNEIPDHDPDDIPFPEPRQTASGLRGVRRGARGKKWAARVKIKGKEIHIGTFATPEEAAKARDAYVVKHGLNLPLSLAV